MSEHEIIVPGKPTRATMIKGLVPALPERGKIKIGYKGRVIKSRLGNKFQPPEKLDHFLITTTERDSTDNFKKDAEIHKRLGEKPTEIPVRLLYDDPTLNFPTRYACFRGRTLWCSGDGERASRLANDGTYHDIQCPCPRKDPGYAGPDKCKMNGALSVMIDGAGGLGGVWKFRTTSYNSIVNILSAMALLRSVTGGALANIPLILRVGPKQGTKPDGSPVTIFMVSLEYPGDADSLQQRALARSQSMMNIASIEAEARRMLSLSPPSIPLAGDTVSDVVEEFYPEQVSPADYDETTGEVHHTLEERARHSAAAGKDALAVFWKALTQDERHEIKGLVLPPKPGEYAELTHIAIAADAARALAEANAADDAAAAAAEELPDDPFGLPPITEQAQPDAQAEPAEEGSPPAPSSAGPDRPSVVDMLGARSDKLHTDSEVSLPPRRGALIVDFRTDLVGEAMHEATCDDLIAAFKVLPTLAEMHRFIKANSQTIQALSDEADERWREASAERMREKADG
jgi:hypothetical protein